MISSDIESIEQLLLHAVTESQKSVATLHEVNPNPKTLTLTLTLSFHEVNLHKYTAILRLWIEIQERLAEILTRFEDLRLKYLIGFN